LKGAPLNRTIQIAIRVSPEVHEATERLRGKLNRTEWLNRLIEREIVSASDAAPQNPEKRP
jgi:hypothetical protein